MSIAALIVLSIAVSGSGASFALSGAAAQERASSSAREDVAEEVIVRGRRFGELRLQIQAAREHAYAIFNEINSNDDFDVSCREERKYHSRAKRRICRARFEDRITAEAAAEYMSTLKFVCPPSPSGAANIQVCIFSAYGQQAANAARRVEQALPNKRDEMNDEIVRLANENHEFAQAILDYYEIHQRYDEARGRGAKAN